MGIIHFKSMPLGPYGANCTILWNDEGKTLVIDPGAEPECVIEALERLSLTPSAIFLTHGHFDHISGVDGLVAKYQMPVIMHAEDEELAFCDLNLSQPGYSGMARGGRLILINDDDGEGAVTKYFPSCRVIHTPGHSRGSCCLHFPEDSLLIAGDTLFAGSIGRTDLPGGSYAEIMNSLRGLAALPPETRVICGHGPSTTIGHEKAYNPFLAR